MFKPNEQERESMATWNSFVAHIADLDQVFENEDMYSVALGFFLARGHEPDQAHQMASDRRTVL